MTEAEITDIFGPRCAVFNARCGSCLMWRAQAWTRCEPAAVPLPPSRAATG